MAASGDGAESCTVVNYDLNWDIENFTSKTRVEKIFSVPNEINAQFSLVGLDFGSVGSRRNMYRFYLQSTHKIFTKILRVQFEIKIQSASSEYAETTNKEKCVLIPYFPFMLFEVSAYSETLRPSSRIIPFLHDFLSLKCHFKFFIITLQQAAILDPPNVPVVNATPERRCNLCSDFKSLYDSKEMADITINIGEDSRLAHKLVLVARSPVFKAMLSDDCLESSTKTIEIPDIGVRAFDCFLNYLYCCEIYDKDLDTVRNMYMLADRYGVGGLKEDCRLNVEFKIETACQLLEIAHLYADETLKQMTFEFIRLHFSEVGKRQEWIKICKDYPELASEVLGIITLFLDKSKQ